MVLEVRAWYQCWGGGIWGNDGRNGRAEEKSKVFWLYTKRPYHKNNK